MIQVLIGRVRDEPFVRYEEMTMMNARPARGERRRTFEGVSQFTANQLRKTVGREFDSPVDSTDAASQLYELTKA